MTCRESVLSSTFDIDMYPKVKMCNEFKEFLSLRCLAPLESSMGYWKKIGNRKSAQKETNEQS